jgi:hypothetical protein
VGHAIARIAKHLLQRNNGNITNKKSSNKNRKKMDHLSPQQAQVMPIGN